MLSKKEIKANKIVAAIWDTALDDQVCEACASLHNRIFPIYSRELKKIDPPIHKGCRCRLRYVTQDERGIKERLKEYRPVDFRKLKKGMGRKRVIQGDGQGKKKGKKGKGCLIAFIIVFLIIVVSVIIALVSEEEKESAPTKTETQVQKKTKEIQTETGKPTKTETQTEPEVLKYTIVGKEDISYAGTPRMTFRVIPEVEKIPPDEQLEKMALRIWEKGNKGWKEFTVFIYLPDMDTRLMAYGVAEFRPQGLKKFEINELALYGTKWESLKKKPIPTKTETQIQTETKKPTQTSISYSKKEVYDFVINYPIYGEEAKELGYTIGSMTDMLVGILRSEGQKVDVVEGWAEPTGEKGIWRVSYVVVADGKRDKVIYVADMNKKTVEPDNQIARDLFYGE